MATREQVLSCCALATTTSRSPSWLQIRPGLAYLLATGLPADGSDTPAVGGHDRTGWLSSSQHLPNPQPAENPTRTSTVVDWVAGRVAQDQQMQQADAARDAASGEKEIPDGPQDVLDVLARDHNQVKAMLEQLSTIPARSGAARPRRCRRARSDLSCVAAARVRSGPLGQSSAVSRRARVRSDPLGQISAVSRRPG